MTASPSTAFARRLGWRARNANLIGLEHEFVVLSGDVKLDFRRVIHGLPIDGRRLDPGDPNAYRCRWGGVVTADGREAEVAIPPVRRRPGFARALTGAAARARRELESVLPPSLTLEGYSTHLNVSVPDESNEEACRLYARTFAAPLILLLAGHPGSGLLIRPRPGRLELGGEYAEGDQLRAATAFAVASAHAAVLAAADGQDASGLLPPAIEARTQDGVERYGWYVDRAAFGVDLVVAGRRAVLRRVDGGTITAQEHLELAWSVARKALGAQLTARDAEAVDLVVAGASPLPSESWPPPGYRSQGRRNGHVEPAALDARLPPEGDLLAPRHRRTFTVTPEVATWDATIFRIAGRTRLGLATVPRSSLGTFLARLDEGGLDDVITAHLEAGPGGRLIGGRTDLLRPGLWDGIAPGADLLAPELPPIGAVGVGAGGALAVASGRPGKVRTDGGTTIPGGGLGRPPPIPEETTTTMGEDRRRTFPGCLPVPLVAIVIGILVVAAGAFAFLGGGGAPAPTATATTSPVAAGTPAPTPTATPSGTPAISPGTVVTPSPTPTLTPSPTPIPPITPSPAPTPTPIPPGQRTDFIEALVEIGIFEVVPTPEQVEAASILDPLMDWFKWDGGPVDVANPVDIVGGMLMSTDVLDPEARANLLAGCGGIGHQPAVAALGMTAGTTDRFVQTCGERTDMEGRVNIIWIGFAEPLTQLSGGVFVTADRDGDPADNGRTTRDFPFATTQAGDNQFIGMFVDGRIAMKRLDFNRPGRALETDTVQLFGTRSVGWLIFGDWATFAPGVEVFEGLGDLQDDVLGPAPVRGEPYPAGYPPYDLTQP